MTYLPIVVLSFFWAVNTLVVVRRVFSKEESDRGSTGGLVFAALLSLSWLWAILSVTPRV